MGVSVAGKLLVNFVNILILSSVCLFMTKKWLLLGHQSIKRELYLVSEYSSKLGFDSFFTLHLDYLESTYILMFHFQFSAFTITEQCFGSGNEPCSSHNPGKLCIHHYFIIKYSIPISSLYLIFCTLQLSILHFLLRFADGIVSIHSSMQGTLFKKFR